MLSEEASGAREEEEEAMNGGKELDEADGKKEVHGAKFSSTLQKFDCCFCLF